MRELRQSTATTQKIGPFVDDADGKTLETELTIAQGDVKISKNGGTYAQKNDATGCTHDASGEYGCPFDATDTGTLGTLTAVIAVAGALPVKEYFSVITAEQWDTKYGSDKFTVEIAENQDVRNVTGTVAAVTDVLAAIKGDGWTTQSLVALKTAIDAKLATASYVAPPSIDDLATKAEVTGALNSLVAAMPAATDVSDLETAIGEVKEKTDQLVITEGKVAAEATATVGSEAIANALDASELLTSIDATLTSVNTRVAPGSVLSVRSAIDNTGTITTKRGDDYVQGDLSIVYTATDLTGIDSIALNILSANGTVLSTHTPVVADAGTSTQTIHIVLSDTETTAIPAGTVLLYEVVIVDGAVSKTIIEGAWISRD